MQLNGLAGIQEERRRLSKVQSDLKAALTRPVSQGFLQASVRYMAAAMERLIAQDLALVHRLRPRVPAEEGDAHAFLDDLQSRLSARKREIAALTAAAQELARTGDRTAFARAVTAYFEPGSLAPGRPKHSIRPLSEKYLTEADWQHVWSASPGQEEPALFAEVAALRPADLPETAASP